LKRRSEEGTCGQTKKGLSISASTLPHVTAFTSAIWHYQWIVGDRRQFSAITFLIRNHT